MKFGMLAAAAVLVASFFVLEAPAQETIQSSGTIVTSDYRTEQPARRGLFSRLRNRNNNNNSTMTTVAPATIAPTSATTTTQIVPAKPLPSTTTPSTTTPSTTTPSTVTQGTPIIVEPTTQIAEPRQGLFARLRARR